MPRAREFDEFFEENALRGNGHNITPAVREAFRIAHSEEWHNRNGESRKRLSRAPFNIKPIRDHIMAGRRPLYNKLLKAHKDLGPHHL